MPPPQKKPKPPPRKGQSVYPARGVRVPLGGLTSIVLSQAVECWAKLLERATVDAAGRLSPGEWNFLAGAASGRERDIDAAWDNPGDHAAQFCERAANLELGLALLHRDRAKARAMAAELAARLRAMDYVTAWAVLWALRWRASLEAAPGEGEEWWTLAHRQKTLGDS